ncbi:sulfurtransferase complex subunit TusB [Seongchinamella sediminis]|uniref:Sulfurtransferase complex subunit TusB n=1 Tax=Seongchinamella sediminis TaxID=2283635 RepID=A0A3L7E3S5_9GAMM|nr:sulfurtransferase complex subunit TusB [Seongchinamella sediminis]RLQ23061.1 sulfurtransferase complex subunit TusB [Seongchinamella sediminis]
MLLHTLNCAADSEAFHDCLRTAGPEDTIVLLGEGVYRALPGTASRRDLDASPARVVVLDTDADAAGVTPRLGGLALVDMDALVALSETYPRQIAWY